MTGADMKQEPVLGVEDPESSAPHTSSREPGYTAYKLDGCRCPVCSAAVSAYNRKVAMGRTAGTWQPFADARPVRDHALALRAAGIGRRRLAELAGVPETTVRGLMLGRRGRPIEKIRTETARRILAVRPGPQAPKDKAVVASTGHVRRMRALIAAGYPGAFLATRFGMTTANFLSSLSRSKVLASTDRAGRELFSELWNRDPAKQGVRPASLSRAKSLARAKGWAPALAWDEERIDDPKARPRGVERRAA